MPKALSTTVLIPEIVRQAQVLADQLSFPRMATGHPVGDQDPLRRAYRKSDVSCQPSPLPNPLP